MSTKKCDKSVVLWLSLVYRFPDKLSFEIQQKSFLLYLVFVSFNKSFKTIIANLRKSKLLVSKITIVLKSFEVVKNELV